MAIKKITIYGPSTRRLIQSATSPEMIYDMMGRTLTIDASRDTKRKWQKAAEKRLAFLKSHVL